MIHTSKQLKDLVRNLTKGNSSQAQIVMRNYIMERFWSDCHYPIIVIILY